jgi:hypothetical protein
VAPGKTEKERTNSRRRRPRLGRRALTRWGGRLAVYQMRRAVYYTSFGQGEWNDTIQVSHGRSSHLLPAALYAFGILY